MEASRVTDFSALNMEQCKSRWMRLDISTEERETGQLNGPQGCPGSRHQLCPLNINWLCGVCAAAGTVFPQKQEQGAMPALQTLTVRWLSVKQTHPVVDTEPEMSSLETSFSKNTSQLHPLAVGAFPMLLQWPAGSAGLIPAGLKESQGKLGLEFWKESMRTEICRQKALLGLAGLGLTLDVSTFRLGSLASQ